MKILWLCGPPLMHLCGYGVLLAVHRHDHAASLGYALVLTGFILHSPLWRTQKRRAQRRA